MAEPGRTIHDRIDSAAAWCTAHMRWLLGGGVFFALVGFSVLLGFLHFGSFTDPNACALCHETRYDYENYRSHPAFKPVRGVNVGCAECHPQNFYEYSKSAHFKGLNGVNPGCVTCHGETHTPGDFARFMFGSGPWFWSEAGSGLGGGFWDIASPTVDLNRWEKFRPRLAEKVRQKFRDTNSAACLQCHDANLLAQSESIAAVADVHTQAVKSGFSCIECHQSVVHAPPIAERESLIDHADLVAGRNLYSENCAGCHGEDGSAVTPAAPSFALGERLYKPDATLLTVIKQGKGDAMPGFGEDLADHELRSMLAYVRSLSRVGSPFHASGASPAMVEMLRAKAVDLVTGSSSTTFPRLEGSISIPIAAEVCQACHYLDRDKRKVGPSLFGKAGGTVTIEGLPFDIWTDENLDAFLTNPGALKPGTRMRFAGIKNAADRAEVIAFLKTLKR